MPRQPSPRCPKPGDWVSKEKIAERLKKFGTGSPDSMDDGIVYGPSVTAGERWGAAVGVQHRGNIEKALNTVSSGMSGDDIPRFLAALKSIVERLAGMVYDATLAYAGEMKTLLLTAAEENPKQGLEAIVNDAIRSNAQVGYVTIRLDDFAEVLPGTVSGIDFGGCEGVNGVPLKQIMNVAVARLCVFHA